MIEFEQLSPEEQQLAVRLLEHHRQLEQHDQEYRARRERERALEEDAKRRITSNLTTCPACGTSGKVGGVTFDLAEDDPCVIFSCPQCWRDTYVQLNGREMHENK